MSGMIKDNEKAGYFKFVSGVHEVPDRGRRALCAPEEEAVPESDIFLNKGNALQQQNNRITN